MKILPLFGLSLRGGSAGEPLGSRLGERLFKYTPSRRRGGELKIPRAILFFAGARAPR